MNALITYACELKRDGKLDGETKERCRETARKFLKTKKWDFIILTAGVFPRSKRSLADLMKECLIRLGVKEDKIISKGIAKNTEGETDIAFELLRERNFNSIGVVSSWYHLLRIWWLWHKKGIRVRLFPSFFTTNPLEVYAEPLKILLVWAGLKKSKVARAV